jgi:hypothetical protein
VLPGHETEPGRELPARTELRSIADGRHQCRRGDNTDTGDRRKSAACLVGAVPGRKPCLQRLNPALGRPQLPDQGAKRFPRQGGQPHVIGIFDDGDERQCQSKSP